MTSMTGYAYKEISNEQANISVEIKMASYLSDYNIIVYF